MSEWISVEDRLPGIDTIVELKFNEYGREYQFSSKLSSLVTLSHMTHWRPIPEKRPDFSKLRKGDMVIIKLSNNKYNEKIGYFNKIIEKSLCLTSYKDAYNGNIFHDFNNIKKITRINLEEEKFEEI